MGHHLMTPSPSPEARPCWERHAQHGSAKGQGQGPAPYLEGDGLVGLGGHEQVLPAPVRGLDPLLVGRHEAVAGHDALGDLGVVDLWGHGPVAAPLSRAPLATSPGAQLTWKRRLCWPISVSRCLVTATQEVLRSRLACCPPKAEDPLMKGGTLRNPTAGGHRRGQRGLCAAGATCQRPRGWRWENGLRAALRPGLGQPSRAEDRHGGGAGEAAPAPGTGRPSRQGSAASGVAPHSSGHATSFRVLLCLPPCQDRDRAAYRGPKAFGGQPSDPDTPAGIRQAGLPPGLCSAGDTQDPPPFVRFWLSNPSHAELRLPPAPERLPCGPSLSRPTLSGRRAWTTPSAQDRDTPGPPPPSHSSSPRT